MMYPHSRILTGLMQSLINRQRALLTSIVAVLWLFTSTLAFSSNLETAMQAYETGDASTAATLLKVEAEQGVSEAQMALGYLYYVGRGVAQNAALAARWFNSAAENGEPAAMYNLAWLYETGEGVSVNSAKRASWLKRSADAGYPLAQYEWAQQLEHNHAFAQAQVWYKKAAITGLQQAHQALQRLNGKRSVTAQNVAVKPQAAAVLEASVIKIPVQSKQPQVPALVNQAPSRTPVLRSPVSRGARLPAVVKPAARLPALPSVINSRSAPVTANYAFVVVSIANMRVAPSTQARTVSRLVKGVELIIHETFGGWTRVTVVNQPQLTGWVNTAVYQSPNRKSP